MNNNTVISEQRESYRSRARSTLHQEILDVASKILSKHGPDGLSMRKIAEEVGASTMVLYTTFGSKHGLMEELWVEGFERLWKAEAGVQRQENGLRQLFALANAYRNNALANPHYYRITFGGTIDPRQLSDDARKAGLKTFGVLVDLVARCMDEGDLQAGEAQEAASFLWSGLHGIVSLELAGLLLDKHNNDKFFELSMRRLIGALYVEQGGKLAAPKAKKNKRRKKSK